jgi:hypothetical protein
VVIEFAAVLKTYRITDVQGDQHAGEWSHERFREHGITYETAAKQKSDLYRDLLPAIYSRMVDLLEHARLFTQIVGLATSPTPWPVLSCPSDRTSRTFLETSARSIARCAFDTASALVIA